MSIRVKKKLFNNLHILDLEEDTFPLPNHSHTFYELVYVLKGKGKHHLNNIVTTYNPGDLFLISPADEHRFEFDLRSRMIFIKFTSEYFKSNKLNIHNMNSFDDPEKVMRNKMLKEQKLSFDKTSKDVLKRIIETILDYNKNNNILNSTVIFHQLISLFALVKEYAEKMNIHYENQPLNKRDIISYLHQNIYSPDKLRVSNLASTFNISKTYFSNYFKRNFEMSLRNYVTLYRLEIIENRIKFSNCTIK